jgi:hypothetical protein
MQFEGAVIKEQGVTFGVLSVKSGVIGNSTRAAESRAFGIRVWGQMPIVLATVEGGRPRYEGRPDLVKFLASIFAEKIPWATWTI